MAKKPFSSGCLMCGKPSLEARGLCSKHYRRFMSNMDEFTDAADAELFEAQCLADGWILPKQKGGRPKEKDPFDEIAERVRNLTQTELVRGSDITPPEPIGKGSAPVGRHRKKAKLPSPEEVKETLKPKKSDKKQGGAG